MIRRLIAKEILMNLLSLRLTFAFLILVPLVALGVYTLCNDYVQRKEDYDSKVSLHQQAAATDRIRVDRPPSPLMALVGGATVTTGNTVHLNYYDAPRVRGGFDHTPIFYIFPRTDYIFIVGIVMSLLALIFSYDAISGERERGTLRLVMSNSVPRDVVLLSKWVGGYLSALFPCMTALLFGILVLTLHPAVELATMDWYVLFLLLLIACIYIAVFFSVGILISAVSPTTGSAAMRCLFVWVLFVLIIPGAATHIARHFVPTPPTQEMERRYDRIVADTAQDRYSDHAIASKQMSNTKPVKDRDEYWRIRTRVEKKIVEIEHSHLTRQRDSLRQIANTYDSRLQSQIRLSRILSYCSPYALLTDIAMTLADTGGESQVAFLEQVRQYEDDYFEELHTRGEITYFYYHVDDIPSFSLASPGLRERMGRSLTGMGLLAFFGILCFMAGYLLFLRRPL